MKNKTTFVFFSFLLLILCSLNVYGRDLLLSFPLSNQNVTLTSYTAMPLVVDVANESDITNLVDLTSNLDAIDSFGTYIMDTAGTNTLNNGFYWIKKTTDSSFARLFRQDSLGLAGGSTTTNVSFNFFLNQTYLTGNSTTNMFFDSISDGVCASNLWIRLIQNNDIQARCQHNVGSGTLTDVNFQCSRSNIVFNRIDVIWELCSGGSNGQFRMDYINITNVFSPIDNQLPTFNVLYNSSILCSGTETANATFEFKINASDPEGDTLYYSINDVVFDRTELVFREDLVTIDFTRDVCPVDYEFFTRENYISNFTTANSVLATGLVLINPLNRDTHFILPNDLCEGVLVTRDEVETWQLDFGNSYRFDNNGIIGLASFNDNVKFDVLGLQSTGVQIFNFTINQTSGGNLTILFDNVLLYNNASGTYNVNDLSNEIIFSWTLSSDNQTLEYSFRKDNDDLFNNTINVTYNNFRSFVFETTDTGSIQWAFTGIRMDGFNFNPSPVFSTVEPTNFEFDTRGTFFLDFFVSDVVHQPTEFTNQSVVVTILPCGETTRASDIVDQKVDVTGLGRAFKSSWSDFCEPWNQITLGSTNTRLAFNFCSILVWIAIVISFIVAAIVYGIFKDWMVTFVVWDLVMLFFSIFIEYNTVFKIVLGLALAIPTAVLFRYMLSGKGSNGGDTVE